MRDAVECCDTRRWCDLCAPHVIDIGPPTKSSPLKISAHTVPLYSLRKADATPPTAGVTFPLKGAVLIFPGNVKEGASFTLIFPRHVKEGSELLTLTGTLCIHVQIPTAGVSPSALLLIKLAITSPTCTSLALLFNSLIPTSLSLGTDSVRCFSVDVQSVSTKPYMVPCLTLFALLQRTVPPIWAQVL